MNTSYNPNSETLQPKLKVIEGGNGKDHEPVKEKSVSTKPLLLSSAAFVADFVPPDYLIDGILQRQFLYSITGPTGAGKTAVALLVAMHVARGLPLAGRDIEKGKVLFLAGENPDDVRMRWIKLCEEHNVDPAEVDVVWHPGSLTLSDKDLRARIEAETEQHGPFALVIIDTSAAFFEGDDENSNTQLGNHARTMRSYIGTVSGGPTILVTTHPTKNASPDALVPRGGSAFLNEVDGNLTCAKQPDNMLVEVHWYGKFRGPDFAPIPFQLVPGTSEKLKDSKGRSIWTVTARAISEQEQRHAQETAREDQDDLLVVMRANPDLVTLTEFARKVGWFYKDGTPNKTKVNRTLQALKRAGLVNNARDRWTVTKAGAAAPARRSKPQGEMFR